MNTRLPGILLGFLVVGIAFTGGAAAAPITGPITDDAPITDSPITVDVPITQSPITAAAAPITNAPITGPITDAPITYSPITS